MAVTSKRTVDSVLSGSKVIAMEKFISLLEPEAAPLTTMLMKTGRKTVSNPTFYHREQELRPRIVTCVYAYAADAATVYVSGSAGTYSIGVDATYVNPKDTIYNTRTKELMLVTAVATTTGALTVSPDRAGTSNAAGIAGDELYIIGSTFNEDSTAPAVIMTTEVLKTFYTQIFKDACSVTKSATATEMYHGNDRLWQQKIKMIEHKIKLELSLLLGGPGATPANQTVTGEIGYTRYTVSLLGWITSNKVIVGGNLTASQLWSAARKCGEYHYGDFLLLCSPMIAGAISSWGIPHMELSPLSKEYGMDINLVRSPHGNIHIVQERLLRGDVLSGYGFMLPMPVQDFIKYRPLVGNGENRDTRLLTNIKTDDDPDYYKDEVKTEAGWEFYEEKKMCLITGVTG